jgi:hypothetical protein
MHLVKHVYIISTESLETVENQHSTRLNATAPKLLHNTLTSIQILKLWVKEPPYITALALQAGLVTRVLVVATKAHSVPGRSTTARSTRCHAATAAITRSISKIEMVVNHARERGRLRLGMVSKQSKAIKRRRRVKKMRHFGIQGKTIRSLRSRLTPTKHVIMGSRMRDKLCFTLQSILDEFRIIKELFLLDCTLQETFLKL